MRFMPAESGSAMRNVRTRARSGAGIALSSLAVSKHEAHVRQIQKHTLQGLVLKARCSLHLEQAVQCGQWVIAVGFELVDFINDYERVGHGLAADDDARAVKTAELIKAEQAADKFRQGCNRFLT